MVLGMAVQITADRTLVQVLVKRTVDATFTSCSYQSFLNSSASALLLFCFFGIVVTPPYNAS